MTNRPQLSWAKSTQKGSFRWEDRINSIEFPFIMDRSVARSITFLYKLLVCTFWSSCNYICVPMMPLRLLDNVCSTSSDPLRCLWLEVRVLVLYNHLLKSLWMHGGCVMHTNPVLAWSFPFPLSDSESPSHFQCVLKRLPESISSSINCLNRRELF